ncbi:hypothetical protein FBQ82_02390 [Anaerolineae bacterium CFX7]|nr:hypothetical protein [Anaerolineae bacterium CFX7]
MGIVHFAGVGTSPGAVTSPLAYLKQHPKRFPHEGAIAESVVVFCSHDVSQGGRLADDFVWNSYGRTGSRQGWEKPRKPSDVIEVIQDFLTNKKYDVSLEGGKLYVWAVDVQDYNECFRAIAQATIALGHGTSGQGKFVWANLTGGTNVLNAALMQVALLSGLIGRMYYAFLARGEDRKYLLPHTSDDAVYRLDEVPLIKSAFDENYYRVLHVLRDKGQEWWDAETLLYFLKEQDGQTFGSVDVEQIRKQYLLRMSNKEIEQNKQGQMRLSASGVALLEQIEDPLFQALVKREQPVAEEVLLTCRQELDGKKL